MRIRKHFRIENSGYLLDELGNKPVFCTPTATVYLHQEVEGVINVGNVREVPTVKYASGLEAVSQRLFSRWLPSTSDKRRDYISIGKVPMLG